MHPVWLPIAAGLVVALSGCERPDTVKRTPTAGGSDRAAVERARRPDVLVAHLGLRPGARVADVGAGAGALEPHLLSALGPDGRVVATDVDPWAVAALARLSDRSGGRLEPRWVGANDPGLEPGAFDMVVLARVDHLLADRAAFLRRLQPTLAPRGRIAVVNRIDREPAVRRAAAAAGLRVVASYRDLPAQFLVVLAPDGRRR